MTSYNAVISACEKGAEWAVPVELLKEIGTQLDACEVSNSRAAEKWASSVGGLDRGRLARRLRLSYVFLRSVRCAYQHSKRTLSRPSTEPSHF